jgi:hypothetical protein
LTDRNVICRHCRKKSPKSQMHCELTGKEKKVRKYFHHECWEFKCNELKEWNELFNTVKEIYGYPDIPKGFISILQKLRNGTITFNKKEIKKYKKGVPYSIIKKSYEMNRKKIQWVKNNKNFKKTISEFMYGFRIIESRINDAFNELKRIEAEKNMYVNPDHSYSDFEVSPLKKFPKS